MVRGVGGVGVFGVGLGLGFVSLADIIYFVVAAQVFFTDSVVRIL